MGSGFSKLTLDTEQKTWSKHEIEYNNERIRLLSQNILEDAFPLGTALKLAYQTQKLDNFDYEHWFIGTADDTYFLEYTAGDSDYHSSTVQINTVPHAKSNYKVSKEGVVDTLMKDRIQHVLGMSNFSLCLRNCEHVCNYVFKGRWVSFQMVSSGSIMKELHKELTEDAKRKVNTFPKSSQPLQLSCGKEKIYTFIENHYSAKEYCSYLGDCEDSYNILVVGPTGAGKSRLVNVMFNQPVCSSSSSHSSVTSDIYFIKGTGKVFNYNTNSYDDTKVVVADTIGLCDTDWKDEEVIDLIQSRVSSSFKYIDVVLVVFKADRLLKDMKANIKKILDWLGYGKNESLRRNFIFVVTHAEYLSDDEKTSMAEQAKKDLDIQLENDSSRLPYFVYVGFPPENFLNKETREDVKQSWELIQRLLRLGRMMSSFSSPEPGRIKVPSVERSSCFIL